MKRLDLIKIAHNVKIGDICPEIEPTVTDDCILYDNGVPIGFYLKQMPTKMCKLADLANAELRSKNVPKSPMNRTSGETGNTKKVQQYSCIIGSVPPRAHMKRPYPSISSVHSVNTAQIFIKSMLMLANQAELLIKDILPEQYNRQTELFKSVPDKFKFGKLFTSSISNYNISAPYHRDAANIEGCVNVIIAKRLNSVGGNTTIPDYNATVDSADNSILVYPAWRNVHGVTPIKQLHPDGYRNSLIFYPLKAFVGI
jgi:hypothetical protein